MEVLDYATLLSKDNRSQNRKFSALQNNFAIEQG